MALKKARKVAKKPASDDAAGASSSMAPPPPPGPGGASKLKPPLLPPGVYFSPTHKESLGFLNRWIAGDKKMPDARGFIFHADVYANNPYALRQLHSPASSRAGQHTWWFLSENKFQSPSAATKRADRSVQTGGYWRLEQGKEELEQEGGLKNSFGFYFGPPKKRKTPWLMQEFTSNKDNGAGKKGVPALHKLYVTPRATDDDLRAIYGEDGVTVGNKKPVPADYFHAAAALLPGSARGLCQEHVGMPQASQPPPPVDLLHYDGQNFMGDIMPVGLHYDSQKGQNFMGAAMPANVLGQYQQQHRHYCRGVAPPAPLGLHDEDAPSDNLSMPMDQFMRILDEPAEKIKGEPEWGSSEDIVDHDEFVNFNKDG